MKIDSDTSLPSTLSDGLQEKNFNILANDKMFGILSSKIYSNKIAAPIRELSCNAYDANIQAGKKDTPIEVHIPSATESYFSVRDCGHGMDSNEIEELYTTYGYSSKTNSNRVVGCLGLGSKSPFAYTNNFTVISVKRGVRLVYLCTLENRMPKIIKFMEEPTTDRPGTEVRFDVKDDDRWSFRAEAARFYSNFLPKPVFSDSEIELTPLKFDHGIAKANSYGVLMGNVLYRFDIGDFPDEYDEFKGYIRSVYSNREFVLKADIGDIDIAVSRETVEMTKKTMDFISTEYNRRVKAITEDFAAQKSSYADPIQYLRDFRSRCKENGFVSYREYTAALNGFEVAVQPFEALEVAASRYESTAKKLVVKYEKGFNLQKHKNDIPWMIYSKSKRLTSSAWLDSWLVNNAERLGGGNIAALVINNEAVYNELMAAGIEFKDIDDFKIKKITDGAKPATEYKYGYYSYSGYGDSISPLSTAEFDDRVGSANVVYYFPVSRGRAMANSSILTFVHKHLPEGAVLVGANDYRLQQIKRKPGKFRPLEELKDELLKVGGEEYMEEVYAYIRGMDSEYHPFLVYLNPILMPQRMKKYCDWRGSHGDNWNQTHFFNDTYDEAGNILKEIRCFINGRYPLLAGVSPYRVDGNAIRSYIEMSDEMLSRKSTAETAAASTTQE